MSSNTSKTALTAFLFSFLLFGADLTAQITITPDTSSQRLTQQLIGGGISISNFKYTGANGAAGFFKVTAASPSLGIDSGIVLSNGYVKTGFRFGVKGVDYSADDANGVNRADNDLNRPGDGDLASIILANYDAAVLEFDFVPTGDSVAFRYVFGSEEYPQYNCSRYNDVFAFFISGPGFVGKKNIALVPNTNIPVAINSINNGVVNGSGSTINPSYCSNLGPGSPFTQYYVSNSLGRHISYNGFTQVLTASAKVQPCQSYHLKLAIADGFDKMFDSGVFLEARSLKSSGVSIFNSNPVTSTGEPYLIEGCNTGGIRIYRNNADNYALPVSLIFGGTATNGTDVSAIPSTVTIPANDSFVFIPITPIQDYLAEGTEILKIYVSNGCVSGSASYSDSILIQVRDYDTLTLIPKDTAGICRSGSLQLTAAPGFTTYSWAPATAVSDAAIRNPIASPSADSTVFICTATQGSCEARDSVKLFYKKLKLLSKQDVICKGATNGQIKLVTGWQWTPPLQFSINNRPPQTDSTFSNLAAGTYVLRVQDASACTDSILVTLGQLYSNLEIDSTRLVQASCTDTTSGTIRLFASGGLAPYTFAVDGTSYQPSNLLTAAVGNHLAIVKDANNCTDTTGFEILFNNIVQVDAGPDTTLCESETAQLAATANVTDLLWSPATAISNVSVANPRVTPPVTTLYTLTARNGFCIRKDSVLVTVRPAPVANAGADTAVCTGGTLRLSGSGGVVYQWTPASFLDNPTLARPTARPLNSITYRLMVRDQYNCASLQADEVRVRTVPSVVAFAGRDTVAAVNQPLQLSGRQLADTSANQYTWTPTTGLNDPNIRNPIALLQRDQTYRLTLRTPQGCEGYDDITIKVYNGPEIYVPSGFTPNGDGRNEVLRAVAVGIKTFKYFNVYNRWGQLVFHTAVSEKGWDGKIDGRLQTNQSFIWIAEGIGYNNQTIQRKGSVIVIQ